MSEVTLKRINNYHFNHGNNIPKRYYIEHKCLVCKNPMFYNRSRSVKMVRLTHWECHYYDKVFKKKRT